MLIEKLFDLKIKLNLLLFETAANGQFFWGEIL